MPNDQAPYATIAEVAAELNARARTCPLGDLREIRRQLKGRPRRLTRKLFDSRATFDSYAFHVGGRTELQFSIGLESGDEELRYGVAFSLETNQTLPYIDVLKRRVKRLKEAKRLIFVGEPALDGDTEEFLACPRKSVCAAGLLRAVRHDVRPTGGLKGPLWRRDPQGLMI